MELDLKPRSGKAMAEGEGGAYFIWSSDEFTMLAKGNVGAGQLVLQPGGFAFPHYADASKVGYVLQGTDGVVGMVFPNTTKEVVLKLKKGDLILVPIGTISWWFNNGESDLILTFLGETTEAHIPGQFTYFFLTGTQGLLGGFSTEVITKAYNLNKDEANKLTKSQTGTLIIKLPKGLKMPTPQMDMTQKLVYNIDNAHPDYGVKDGGFVTTITQTSFPFLGQVGLSVIRVKLEPDAIKAPIFATNPAIQVIYIVRGSGKVEIVGLNGKLVLDAKVKAGDLLVVPQFFVIAEIASHEGMEYFSILTAKKPAFEELVGEGSIWAAISPVVQEAALNVDSDFMKLFLSRIKKTSNVNGGTSYN